MMHYDDLTRAEQDEMLRKELVDAHALADMRTLDAWAMHGRWYQVRQREVVSAVDGDFLCVLGTETRERNGFVGFIADGHTPDEARAKAAAWVREQNGPRLDAPPVETQPRVSSFAEKVERRLARHRPRKT